MLSLIFLAMVPVLAVEAAHSQAVALAPSYNEQLIHQINAARQMAVNKLAASIGTGTGTAHFDGVPGTRFSRPRKGPPQGTAIHANGGATHDARPPPAHHPVPTASYGPPAPPAHYGVVPTPVYPTPAVYTARASYAFPATRYHATPYRAPALYAAFKAPHGHQVYPSGAAYSGHAHRQSYPGTNAFLRVYQNHRPAAHPAPASRPAPPAPHAAPAPHSPPAPHAPPAPHSRRPHAKSASNYLQLFGYDTEPDFFDTQAKLFGYDNSVHEHYVKVMSRLGKNEPTSYGEKPFPAEPKPASFNSPNAKQEETQQVPYEEPKYEEPRYEDPKHGEHKYEEPKYEESSYKEEPLHSEGPLPQPRIEPPKKSYRVPDKTYQNYKQSYGSGRRGSLLQMQYLVPVAIHGYGRY